MVYEGANRLFEKVGTDSMSSKDELAVLLRKYIACICEQAKSLKYSRKKVPYISLGWRSAILEDVESLESLPVFNELLKATKSVYSCRKNSLSMSAWRKSVKNFFRRSGIYVDCFEKGEVIRFEHVLSLYERAFTTRNMVVTYLLPLEGVEFTELREGVTCYREQPLEFGAFCIRRFSPDELSELVNNRVNEIFYPYAAWNVNKLSWYWFLVIKRTEDFPGIGIIVFDFGDIVSIRRKTTPDNLLPLYPDFYKVILFDWLPKELDNQCLEKSGYYLCDLGVNFSVERFEREHSEFIWMPWYGFKVPVVGKVNSALIDSPPAAPDATRLEEVSYFDYNGKEIEGPVEWFELNEEKTQKFEQFIKEEVDLIDESLLVEWPFLKIALEYLTKAFLTDPFSCAPEQLLWHITSIEALLGKKEDERIVDSLARRLSRILGCNSSQRERIEYQFRKLYQIRSDLVHGNQWGDYSVAYLYVARNYAQRACLWFIKLAKFRREKNTVLPTRDEILNCIDSNNIPSLFAFTS